MLYFLKANRQLYQASKDMHIDNFQPLHNFQVLMFSCAVSCVREAGPHLHWPEAKQRWNQNETRLPSWFHRFLARLHTFCFFRSRSASSALRCSSSLAASCLASSSSRESSRNAECGCTAETKHRLLACCCPFSSHLPLQLGPKSQKENEDPLLSIKASTTAVRTSAGASSAFASFVSI